MVVAVVVVVVVVGAWPCNEVQVEARRGVVVIVLCARVLHKGCVRRLSKELSGNPMERQ